MEMLNSGKQNQVTNYETTFNNMASKNLIITSVPLSKASLLTTLASHFTVGLKVLAFQKW